MKINVLDKGYVELIDVMGSDNLIAETARVSTQSNGKNNEGLIRRLMRDRHTSPFEFGEIHIEIKAPIFVFRQMFRHRTLNLNEQSLRYSESDGEFYMPSKERMQAQSVDNRQGSGGTLLTEVVNQCNEVIYESQNNSIMSYKTLLKLGLTREISRIVLPFNLYASARVKCDLHNWLHFLKLRTDSHAQWEIQQYANAIENVVKELFPLTYDAWVDYSKKAVRFSRMEMEYLSYFNWNVNEIKKRIYELDELTKSEQDNFLRKLQ